MIWLYLWGRRGNAQGQPQCRRKVMIVGLPFGFGSCSVEDEGAFAPTSGAEEVSSLGGVSQELSSCWKVMVDRLLF